MCNVARWFVRWRIDFFGHACMASPDAAFCARKRLLFVHHFVHPAVGGMSRLACIAVSLRQCDWLGLL
jgi:hypothetical protein